ASTGTHIAIAPLTNEIDALGVLQAATPELPVPAGRNVDLSGAQTLAGLSPSIENVRYDQIAGLFEADLRLTNSGAAVNADAVVAFGNLPAGITLQNASGLTGDGRPYVNLAPALSASVFASGTSTEALRLQFSDPAALRFPLQAEALGTLAASLVIDPI